MMRVVRIRFVDDPIPLEEVRALAREGFGWSASRARPISGASLGRREVLRHARRRPAARVPRRASMNGARLHEHQAAGPITIQAASGSLRLSAGGQALMLKAGEITVLESALEHEVEALEESALLVTLVKTT
jgi:hypothetical protein